MERNFSLVYKTIIAIYSRNINDNAGKMIKLIPNPSEYALEFSLFIIRKILKLSKITFGFVLY